MILTKTALVLHLIYALFLFGWYFKCCLHCIHINLFEIIFMKFEFHQFYDTNVAKTYICNRSLAIVSIYKLLLLSNYDTDTIIFYHLHHCNIEFK